MSYTFKSQGKSHSPSGILFRLPCGLRDQALWPSPDGSLPQLINAQNPHTECDRQEEVLGRNARRAEGFLECGNVVPKDAHDQGKGDGREEVEVLGGLVEGGRVLEDGETAGSDGHEDKPLPGRLC